MTIFNQWSSRTAREWCNIITGLRTYRLNDTRWLRFLLMLITFATPVSAETITIGKGTGKVWEGMPFSGTLYGNITDALMQAESILFIGTSQNFCNISSPTVATIAGYTGIQLTLGVILVPQVTANGSFISNDGSQKQFAGTIGVPNNDMRMLNNNRQMHYPGTLQPSPWCFHPEGAYGQYTNYFQANSPREIHYSGNWVLFANGRQTSANDIVIPPIYIASEPALHLYVQIFPNTITLRVGSLECTAETNTNVNFGHVPRNASPGAELAIYPTPLTVSCTQDAGSSINANINVQFRAISGLYEGDSRRLMLNPGGGYIIGEIGNGITSAGNCSVVGSGLPFDSTPIGLGSISTGEYIKALEHQIVWRLCSGGASLPTGPVTAAAEMLVTYN